MFYTSNSKCQDNHYTACWDRLCVYYTETKQWLYQWTLDGLSANAAGDNTTSFTYVHDVKATVSNSLTIHKAKKKISTVRMVWLSDKNYDTILRTLALNFSKNFCSFEKLYQKRHSVFHAISRHRQVGRQTRCSRAFFNDHTSNQ